MSFFWSYGPLIYGAIFLAGLVGYLVVYEVRLRRRVRHASEELQQTVPGRPRLELVLDDVDWPWPPQRGAAGPSSGSGRQHGHLVEERIT